MLQRILVAIDGSDHGAKAVEFASAMAMNGQLYRVHEMHSDLDVESRLRDDQPAANPVGLLDPGQR